jgi:hypothetical protein
MTGSSIVEHERGVRGMAHRLDAVTIGIEHECAIIVGVVLGSKSRCAIIPATGAKCGGVEILHRAATWGPEADMGSWHGRFHIRFAGDRKFNPGRSRRSAVIGAAGKIDDANQPQRAKRSVKEPATAIDVAYTERYMVKHNTKPPLTGTISMFVCEF